jgi:hypothetical protein
MSEYREPQVRPQDQAAFEGMELEDVLDVNHLARLMHESGEIRYDVISCMTAQEIVDFVVALASVERPGQGAGAHVARDLIMDLPILARRVAESYAPELFDALGMHERSTYTRVINDYLHDVWLKPERADVETLEQVQEAALYQVQRDRRR